MKRILTIIVLLVSTQSFGQSNKYPLWSTPKDSVDVWLDSVRERLSRAIGSKMDTATAYGIMSIMQQSIKDSSIRQHYNDTNTYDLTKYQASQLYALIASLAPVATSGVYSTLSGKPTALPPNGAAGGSLNGSYPNPTIANNAISSNNILDGTIVNSDISATAGIDYSKLSGTPVIPTNTNQLTNGAGFLTGVTGSQVTTALGYTPYNGATNPNGYISTSSVTVRNKAGVISNSVVLFTDTFSITAATPTIDLSSYISAAGKTNCKVTSAIAYRVGATSSTSPNVSIAGLSNTGVSLLFNQTNTATVTILSINVLSGLPTILTPDPTNIKVLLTAYFY